MSLDNPNGIEYSVSKNTKQRRSFLIKASAVTVVASLPLRSSWAASGAGSCSVSGNLSGNLSQNCAPIMQGKSPSEWKSSLDNIQKNRRWKSIFDNSRDPFPVRSNPRKQNARVKNVLKDGDINAALLAAFYNARAGKYGELNGTAKEYVRGLYDQLSFGEVSESDMLAAIESTYQ